MRWTQYSKKMQEYISCARHAGSMQKSALEEMRLVQSTGALRLYILIDTTDGVIARRDFVLRVLAS